MSVISLSSEDEDECVILDDEERYEKKSLQTHQVFIVERDMENKVEENSESGKFFPDLVNCVKEEEEDSIHIFEDNVTVLNENSVSKNKVSSNDAVTYHSISLSDKVCKKTEHLTNEEIQTEKLFNFCDKSQFNENTSGSTSTDQQSDQVLGPAICFSNKDEGNERAREELFHALQLTSTSVASKLNNKTNSDQMFSQSILDENEVNNQENSFKILAEKLAQVFGNNNNQSDVPTELLDTRCMSNLEKTISEVAKGIFTQDESAYLTLSSTKYRQRHNKIGLSHKNQFSATEPMPQMYLNTNHTPQTDYVNNCKVDQWKSQDSNFINDCSSAQLSQSKHTLSCSRSMIKSKKNKALRSLNTEHNSNIEFDQDTVDKSTMLCESKHKKRSKSQSLYQKLEPINKKKVKLTHDKREKEQKSLNKKQEKESKYSKLTEPKPSSEKEEPYINKLKFTYNKSGAVYSVSIVSQSEPQSTVAESNVSDLQSQQSVFNEESRKSCQSHLQQESEKSSMTSISQEVSTSITKKSPSKNSKENNLHQKPVKPVDSSSLSVPFSNLLDQKANFIKHYNAIFDSKIDNVCTEMGSLLLRNMEISRQLENHSKAAQNDLNDQHNTKNALNTLNSSEELNTKIQNCCKILQQTKRKFVDYFCKIYHQVNLGQIVGTQLKIALLVAWFMKMFLCITSQLPEFLDALHEAKTKSLDLLSEEIVRWPLVSKAFVKEESKFEQDCWLVLDFIKDCCNCKESTSQNIGSVHLDEENLETGIKTTSDASTENNNRNEENESLDKESNCKINDSIQSKASEPGNDIFSDTVKKLPPEQQTLARNCSNELSVIVLSSKPTMKNSNCNDICNNNAVVTKQDDSVVCQGGKSISNNNQHSREPLQLISLSRSPNNATSNVLPPEVSRNNHSDEERRSNLENITKDNSTVISSLLDKTKLGFECIDKSQSMNVHHNMNEDSDVRQKTELNEALENIQPIPGFASSQVKDQSSQRSKSTSQKSTNKKIIKNMERSLVSNTIPDQFCKSVVDQNFLHNNLLFKAQHYEPNTPPVTKELRYTANIRSPEKQESALLNKSTKPFPYKHFVSTESQHFGSKIPNPYKEEIRARTDLTNKQLQFHQLNGIHNDQVQNQHYERNCTRPDGVGNQISLKFQQSNLSENHGHKLSNDVTSHYYSNYSSIHQDMTLKGNFHGNVRIPDLQKQDPIHNYPETNWVGPNNFQPSSYFPNSSARISIQQEFPGSEMGAMEGCVNPINFPAPVYPMCDVVSGPGITINNYNITNYPSHVPSGTTNKASGFS